ncbi:GNAT family N-acetyltransferase [Streptomyces cucumeris]|uniref:GNAT family N-acetyltransferase n=1 Tax=Streptomyces cucumeris TaxID=2962890 RepID=UPI003D71B5BF
MKPRRATSADAQELVRLRNLMFEALSPPSDIDWQSRCVEAFADRLKHDSALAAFVMGDGRHRLFACAVGEYAKRLPSPGSVAPHIGHVHSVVTEPSHRHRGLGSACLTALMRWLAEHDCSHVQLRASPEGQGLYSRLGFQVVTDVQMARRVRPCDE